MTKKRKVEIELSKHCVGGFRMTKRYSYFNANMVGQLKRENKKLKDENEQLKQHNTELINKIDFLERVIDGDV